MPLFWCVERREENQIAIYHLSIKIISRGKGRSAIAAAAYRAGTKIISQYDGKIHDYSRKGGVIHTEILLPENAPPEYTDRAILWNAVEKIEKAKNAQLAREIEVALPVELTREQQISLIRAYVEQHFVATGMCVDLAIHDTGGGNPHAHIMLTMRPFTEDKAWGAKQKKEYILDQQGNKIYDPRKRQYKCKSIPATDWNDQTKAEEWRAAWAELCNLALEQNGHLERIDHRSYERQGIEQIPTIHLGPEAFQMEKRGIRTRRGDINRQIELDNKMLRQLRARISKLEKWFAEEGNLANLPLLDMLTTILDNPEQKYRWQKVMDLKTAAKVLSFLQKNGISDMAGLQNKVTETHNHLNGVSENLKKKERRAKTLDEHILHAENYFAHRTLYREYEQQKPGKKDAFYERHRAELMLYESATRYLQPVMNGRTTIPLKAWKAERSILATEKATLYQEYSKLKENVREAEMIRKSIERTMPEIPSISLGRKSQDISL